MENTQPLWPEQTWLGQGIQQLTATGQESGFLYRSVVFHPAVGPVLETWPILGTSCKIIRILKESNLI